MHMSPCSVLTKKALDTGMHFSLGSRQIKFRRQNWFGNFALNLKFLW